MAARPARRAPPPLRTPPLAPLPPVAPRRGGSRNARATIYQVGGSLLELVQSQDKGIGDQLAENQKALCELKKQIALASKKNFTLEKEVRNLDQKIALLIKNRISLEEVMAQSGDLNLMNRTTTLKDKREKEHYGQLFYVLQTNTTYIARLAQLVKLGQIDNLLQTVMFTLYGNQYDEYEEHLLLSMFQSVLRVEFENSKSISNLLRANTALTRMMTTYTRRSPGQQYLKATLTNILQSIVSDADMALEINPLKVYDQMVNDYETKQGKVWEGKRKPEQEEAEANAEVQAMIAPRVQRLGEISDSIITALIASLDSVPYGIRWICKQIKILAKHHFPSCTREQICTMIGGFFLLRFSNPAIVTPQALAIVDVKVPTNARRNLTLIAKIMQNLANNVRFGGVKESFMGVLNGALDRNRERLNNFLENLCDVDELEEHLQLDKYLVLGKTDELTINISLNEMYFIHSLLREHLEVLCPAEEGDVHQPMRDILQTLGPAPPQLPRKDNANVELVLDKSAYGEDEVDLDDNGQVYAETKYLLFMVLKKLPSLAEDLRFSNNVRELLRAANQLARQRGNNGLVEMIDRINSNCQILVQNGMLSVDDDFAQLQKDAMEELTNYDAFAKKTANDLARLRDVERSIESHREFLMEQLDAYKEYLSNVRQNCARADSRTSKKAKKEDKKKDKKTRRGPFKYSHNQLEKDGIIMESEVPEERRSSIFFAFSSNSPGMFDVTVMYKTRHIAKITLQLDDLLERQHMNELEYETDFLKLNVNLLIYLLNKDFVS
eukprot:TRINITY_DN2751_c0_g5_i1.p1 TRINITY_DN2751_c0_g5~~TRINITY_DN2751_c0_g5_i1.p1  ORF type:complete len:782 (+),score=291.28 TRINITY_DN2751_c0_g5_i1:231-2576(+)